MSWTFYDAFTDHSQHGPMPCKRWQRDGKRHRLRYRSPTRINAGPRSSDRDMERKARDYAYWLAKRDGVAVPATYQVTAIWSGVDVVRPDGRLIWDKRIRAVKFGAVEIALPNWDFVAKVTEEHAHALAA